MYKNIFIFALIALYSTFSIAQDQLRELSSNPIIEAVSKVYKKKTKQTPVYIQLPFVDDFSDYMGYPKESLWMDNSTFVNQQYSHLPPSLGVLTFDALDAFGKLYSHAVPNRIFTADTLTSQYIRLDSAFNPNPYKLKIEDSIFISFYFQPGGGADKMWERSGYTPSYSDSLMLEFWNPVDSVWDYIWSQHGIPLDSIVQETGWEFKYVLIPILDEKYLSKQFQFRFRNFCSLNDQNYQPGFLGNCDQWHIDYIRLDRGRNSMDTAYRDITFTGCAPSFLKNYQAMPSKQYSESELKDSLKIYIANLHSETLPSNYYYVIHDENDQRLDSVTGGFENIPPFFPTHQYQTSPSHASPLVKYTFPSLVQGENTFKITHVVKAGIGSDSRTQNDTMSFSQVFWNYYAYDDGSAENGFGLSTQSEIAWIAYRFFLSMQDTLSSIEIYFNSAYNDGNKIPFYLTVWGDNNGEPGNVIYRSSSVLYPEFNGLNKNNRYVLDNPLLVKGTIYIGIEQVSSDFVNIGFDRNNTATDNILYNIGEGWDTTIYTGALMMRPYFGWEGAISVQTVQQQLPQFKLYPNPANDIVHVNLGNNISATESFQMRIYNMLGQSVFEGKYTESIDISHLTGGVYIFIIFDKRNKTQYSQRLIISR